MRLPSLPVLAALSALVACSGTTDESATSCAVTTDRAEISVSVGALDEMSCARFDSFTQGTETIVREGIVGNVEATTFELDCSAGGCAEPVRIGVVAPGLDIRRALPEGATVRVTSRISYFFACVESLSVESLPSIGSVVNPSPAEGGLYLAAMDGLTVQVDGLETRFDRIRCKHEWSGEDCTGDPDSTGIYALHVSSPHLGEPVVAHMGETVTAPFATSTERWHIRNLRSFQTDICDDYWNWAYWIAMDRAP